MPTNSNYDSYFTGIGDVPIFTYGMITITAGVLAYMTYMDPYIPEEAAEPILEATSMDGVVESIPMDTTVPPQEELPPPQQEEPIPEAEPIPEEEPIPEAQPIPEGEPIPEAEPIQEEKPTAGGKRKKRTTRRSRPSGKKY